MKLVHLTILAFACLLTSLSQAQDTADLTPKWVWVEGANKADSKIYLRKEFEVPATAKRVLLLASGDNKVDVYINGDGRGVSSDQWESPVAEDITDRVERGGKNLLAVRGENAGGSAALFVLIEIEDADGSKSRIGTDETWSATDKPSKGWNKKEYKDIAKWGNAKVMKNFGEAPYDRVSVAVIPHLLDMKQPTATAVERINLADGFKAELLYSVPKADQGSWVAMTIDDKQRLIVSDQYGALYRFPIPKEGETLSPGDIEKINVDIGGAQGLLYAHDSLYVVLNTQEHGGRGLYRITDSDGDDVYDKKELLRKFEEMGGEHGPHAVVLGPDGESLYIVIGNQTPVTEVDSSRIPQVWGEDLLLDRPIGRGFMKGTLAPGGWVAKTDKDGESWELIATGFRNEYDIGFNQLGDMFTYDADMEWDMNTPWYRPTRVNHIASGAEFGWRNGGGKWPAYYPDSLPAVVDIGPGSPTGVVFGTGAKFPAKYQNAFFIADWSYGKLYAVFMEQDGASYSGTFEEFMSAQPLPLTDLVVNPEDGALYIAIGGRRVQSGLYRVTYEGDESTDPAPVPELSELHKLRRKLEGYHKKDEGAVEAVWPYLGHEDRFIRYAARTAIEHQPVSEWQDKALALEEPEAVINGMIALARLGDKSLQGKIIGLLNKIDFASLSTRQRIDLVRAYSLAFTRMGEGTEEVRQSVANVIVPKMPFGSPQLNAEALQLAVYLQQPDTAAIGIDLLNGAPSQEEQMAYAKSLRHLEKGWSRDLRKSFFEWFTRAKAYKGGASFSLFIENMKETALSNTPDEEKVALKEVIEAEPPTEQVFTIEPRAFVQAWTVDDFDDVINVGLEGGRDYANGRKMFGAATCFACHRFNQEGGAIGPDLTSVSGKFSPRDLLESIIEPSKEISDQYGQMVFEMVDGSTIIGRIMNLSGDSFRVNTNMMNPDEIVSIDRKKLKSMEEAPMSMMPPGLVNSLSKDDVLDLLAYLLSKGNPDDPMFAE
ncbi:MAG: heme-binding protein [Verrucomicrobiales bacterium]|nr:heme-binding protein [Verrucomicrobiales bacterium]